MSNKLKCSECGCLEDYDNPLHTDRDDVIVCDECGLKSRCFCDGCGEYVPTSECIVKDQNNEYHLKEFEGFPIEITEVLCGQCQ